MGIIFHSKDITKQLLVELSKDLDDIKIISAYCKLDALKFIDGNMKAKEKKLLVRFRMQDIVSGASDIELYNYCLENKWKLFFDLDLHSKIYVFNDKKAIIGSCNLTLSGLGIGKLPNIESAVEVEMTEDDIVKINNFFNQSTEITQEIYESMIKQISDINVNKYKINDALHWNEDILFLYNKNIKHLWTNEMIFSEYPHDINQHDRTILMLSENCSKEEIAEQFVKSKPYLWLINLITREMYFGEICENLHNALLDDPKPYRKNVKMLLKNILNWIEELGIEDVLVDNPQHSQRVRIANKYDGI